jgi:hypothetical protein
MARRSTNPTWLTRPQVAALAGIGEQEVLALDGKELRPTRESDRSWRYDPGEVAAYLQQRSGAALAAGEIAARAFEMFRAGKDDVDVVIATRRVAAEVRALRAEYARMIGGVLFSAAGTATLRRLFGDAALTDTTVLAEKIERELMSRYERGYLEGQLEGAEIGELVDPTTGERRTVKSRDRE